MRSIVKEWRTFVNEGAAEKYRFETAIRVITDEIMEVIKKNIGKSMTRFDFAEFSFEDGTSASGRKLPEEISEFIDMVYGRIRFLERIPDASEAAVAGSYQASKKRLIVNVALPSDFSLQDIGGSDLNAKIKSLLRHEFEHPLDNIRGIKKTARGLEGGTLEDYRNYFTSPHEINAYTVGFKRKAKALGKDWGEVKNSFLSWLTNDLNSKVNAEKSWDRIRLSPTNRDFATELEVKELIDEIDRKLSAKHFLRYKIKIGITP